MIFEMVNERLTALANKWTDLADTFRRLAASLDANDQRRIMIGEANVDPNDPAKQEKGLQRLCFYLPPGGAITTVSGAGGAAVVVTTKDAHGLVTGDSVVITRAKGFPLANGRFTITKISDSKFSLNANTNVGASTEGRWSKQVDPGEVQRLEDARIMLKPEDPLATQNKTGVIDLAIKLIQESRSRISPGGDRGLSSIRIEFERILVLPASASDPAPAPRLDTVEAIACSESMSELDALIDKNIGDLQELLEEVSERFYLSGIRDSVDNLSGYPILTSEMAPRSMPAAPGGNSGGGQGNGGSFRRSIDGAIRDVLGRLPKASDTRSFLVALSQTFEAVAVEGHTEYRWNPRSFVGQTDLGGGVTGGQASLYTRAKAVEKNVLCLLDGLFPLREDADEELTQAARNIVHTEFQQLVEELSVEGGPRRARVNGLFALLFDREFHVKVDGENKPVRGHLAMLREEYGLTTAHVNTLDEENNVTNYIALRDYIESIRTGWNSFEGTLFGKDLGTRLVLLSRALSVAADSVEEANEAMDSVFVGMAERQVASFHDEKGQRVFVGELLSWITTFASEEAPNLVQSGGRRGVEAIIPTTIIIRDLVDRLIKSIPFESSLPDGMRHPRVINPLRELHGHLELVRRHAEEVKRP